MSAAQVSATKGALYGTQQACGAMEKSRDRLVPSGGEKTILSSWTISQIIWNICFAVGYFSKASDKIHHAIFAKHGIPVTVVGEKLRTQLPSAEHMLEMKEKCTMNHGRLQSCNRSTKPWSKMMWYASDRMDNGGLLQR